MIAVARARLAALVLLAAACDPSATATSSAMSSGVDRGGNCATCHMPEYEHADPVHVDVKPTKCAVCHVQDSWRPSAVHHEFSPLTGAHQKADCTYCHGKGATAAFKGTPKDCITCHRPEYDSSTFPGHATFPTKCADCHTTTAFRPATFTPPPAAAPISTSVSLGGGKTLPLLPRGAKPGSAPRPGVAPLPAPPPPPPRAAPAPPPATRPPDVVSRPSPRRR